MELGQAPITPNSNPSPVWSTLDREFQIKPDTFNKHRLDIRGLSHVKEIRYWNFKFSFSQPYFPVCVCVWVAVSSQPPRLVSRYEASKSLLFLFHRCCCVFPNVNLFDLFKLNVFPWWWMSISSNGCAFLSTDSPTATPMFFHDSFRRSCRPAPKKKSLPNLTIDKPTAAV
jgi:hypothetical protein